MEHYRRIDSELSNAVEDLLCSGYIDNGTPAYETAQQVVHRGYESLSPEQHTLFDNVVIPALDNREEKLWALQGGGNTLY